MTRAYDDIGGSFRRGAAGSRAARGDYDGAAAFVSDDPELANSYAAQGERSYQRQQRDEQQSYARSYTRAAAGNDFQGMETMAAKRGDLEGLTAARGAQQQHTEQERLEGWRILNGYANELEQITEAEDPASGYSAWLTRAREQAQSSPDLAAEVGRWPESFDPGIARRLSGVIRTWQNRLLTPAQLQEMEATTRRLDIQDRGADVAERRAAAAEQTAQAAMLRAERGGGGGGATYRPVTPEEAQTYGLANNGAGYAMSSAGRPVRVGGGNQPLAGAEQRGRIALTFPNIVQAQEDLARLEGGARRRQGTHGSETPYGQDWGARVAEAVPFDGGSAARMIGGADYQAYETASRTFEQSVMPIFSGTAVTESEAQRFVRSNLPRLGDTPQTLEQKTRNRARIINSAAVILGAEAPYPAAGMWSPSGGLQAPEAPAPGVGLESLSDEQLEALEQELLNGGR